MTVSNDDPAVYFRSREIVIPFRFESHAFSVRFRRLPDDSLRFRSWGGISRAAVVSSLDELVSNANSSIKI